MKELLDNYFVQAKGSVVGSVSCVAAMKCGDFSLVDNVACTQCRPFFHRDCDYEVLKLHAEQPVEVINYEKFMIDLRAETGGVCDYLLSGNDRVLFIDLTCGLSQYLDTHLVDGVEKNGKKATSRQQTEVSINRLYEEEHLSKHIDSYQYKIAMLGYRSLDDEIFLTCPSTITAAEEASLSMMKDLQAKRLATPLSHGFKFVTVRYPDIYNI